MFDEPILIISPPRSGSSLLANMIYDAGVFGGTMKPADKWNLNGYFENIEITNVLVEYLRRYDENKFGKRFNPVNLHRPFWELRPLIRKILLRESYGMVEQWFYKNPKLCWTWHIFVSEFPHARWIVVDRPEALVINSIIRTEFMDAYETVAEWKIYYKRCMENIFLLEMHARHVHHADIQKLISGNEDEIKKLESFTGVKNISTNCFAKHAWGTTK